MRTRQLLSKKYICLLIYLIIIILFIFSNILMTSEIVKNILNIILLSFTQVYTFCLFGFDLISSISFLTTISLVPSILVYYNLINYNKNSFGDLTVGYIPINLHMDIVYVFIFVVLWTMIAYIFDINSHEKILLNCVPIKLNNNAIIINNIIAICASFIAFPSLPKFGSVIKEVSFANSLLPGHAWNQLAIVALIFNVPYLFSKKISVIFTYLFVIFWFITHGERADITGLILGIIILLFILNKVSHIKKIISLIIGILFSIFFISIKSGYNFITSLRHIFTFSTINDTSYELNLAIDYINNFGFTHGKIFLNTLISIIPFVHGPHDINYFLTQFEPTPGGSSIVTDPLVDGGLFGLIILILVYLIIIRILIYKKSKILKYELLVLLFSVPRLSWYGIYFVFTSMIFFVPCVYMLDKYFKDDFHE